MELYDVVENVKTKEDVVNFIKYLRKDLKNNSNEWENITLEDYLEGLEAWLDSCENVYKNLGEEPPSKPSWQFIAQLLWSASTYE